MLTHGKMFQNKLDVRLLILQRFISTFMAGFVTIRVSPESNRATAQPRNRATAQPRNRATAQPRNRATAQPRNRATAQ
jgi:hypothetical protein